MTCSAMPARSRDRASTGSRGGGFGDVFNDIFEDFFGGQRGGNRAERGNDLQYNLELTFEEAVYGKEAKLKIPRWEICGDCKGTGAKSAASIKTCPSCKGAGQIRFQQGFFSVSRPCGQCEGAGRIVTEPCRHLPRSPTDLSRAYHRRPYSRRHRNRHALTPVQ